MALVHFDALGKDGKLISCFLDFAPHRRCSRLEDFDVIGYSYPANWDFHLINRFLT